MWAFIAELGLCLGVSFQRGGYMSDDRLSIGSLLALGRGVLWGYLYKLLWTHGAVE